MQRDTFATAVVEHEAAVLDELLLEAELGSLVLETVKSTVLAEHVLNVWQFLFEHLVVFTLEGGTPLVVLIACCLGGLELVLEEFRLVTIPGWLWSHHLCESCFVGLIC